jgi:hypothetical protein
MRNWMASTGWYGALGITLAFVALLVTRLGEHRLKPAPQRR